MKCFERTSEYERSDIFMNFRSINDKNQQDTFLQGLIEKTDVVRKRPRSLDGVNNKPRAANFCYTLLVPEGNKIRVCKKAFCSIFGVSENRVRRLTSLLLSGKSPVDKRGSAPCSFAKKGESVLQVIDHIKSFPTKISHYSSKEVHYLSAELNVKTMYELFKAKFPTTDIKYEYYLKIFKERFSLKFGRPEVDSCVTCETLNVRLKNTHLNPNAKRVAAAEKLVHQRRANKFYKKLRELKEKCQSDKSCVALCFDFMMNLSLPNIPVQDIFYYRQLTVNVFCVTDLASNKSKLYVYHQGVGGKGPNSVTSFLHDYISKNVMNKGVKHLYLFSDNCGGQNKNHTVVRYFNALTELKFFDTITQFYPIRGHSFLPCDRTFGAIKRNLKKHDRVYTVWQYIRLWPTQQKTWKFKR